MKASSEIMLRRIAGENLLVPIGEAAARFQGIISLNDSGRLLWETLQKGCTRDDLIAAILDAYDVDEPTAARDVDEFLTIVRTQNFLLEE